MKKNSSSKATDSKINSFENKKICGIYYLRDQNGMPFHRAHMPWFDSIPNLKITSYKLDILPDAISSGGILAQKSSFLKSTIMPQADIYIMESISCIPSVIFKKGKKIIINTDTFFKDLENYSGIKKKYANWLLNKVDGIISTSPMMRELSRKYTDVPNEVIYPFVDVKKFLKIKPKYKKHTICSINMSHSKGTDILVEVFKKYQEIHKDAKLIVLGEDSMKKEIQKVPGVITPGFCDPAPYLKEASIYMNTARHEPFGLNIIEAMASGQIPIVSEYCGAKEFVEKVDKSLITDLNPENILKTILKVEKRKDLAKLRETCRQVAREFTKEKCVNDFKLKLNKLLEDIEHDEKEKNKVT